MYFVRYFIVFVSFILLFANGNKSKDGHESIIVYQVKLENEKPKTIRALAKQPLQEHKLPGNISVFAFSQKILDYMPNNIQSCNQIIRDKVYFYGKIRKQYDITCHTDDNQIIADIIEYEGIGLQFYNLSIIKDGKITNNVQIKISEIIDKNNSIKAEKLYTPENLHIIWEENKNDVSLHP